MDIRKIKKLIELVQASDIAELEISEGEESIKICRHSPIPLQAGQQAFLAPASSMAAATPQPIQDNELVHQQAPKTVSTQPMNEVEDQLLSSPMVGTVYLTQKDGVTPLCQVGKQVIEGETVCVIEAMTMMNDIAAHTSGTIKSIFVEEGQLVDFEQPLLLIE